jgi:hypothetical protein
VRRYKSGQCSISNSINLQEFNSATALLFTPSFLTPFVTNVKAMKGVVYSYRKTRFLEGKKEIFNVGLNGTSLGTISRQKWLAGECG